MEKTVSYQNKMKQEPKIYRDTVQHLSENGFEFFILIPTGKECNTTLDKVAIKVSAIQLSKAVLQANRKDEVIVDMRYGRNGRKAAYVIEIPRV